MATIFSEKTCQAFLTLLGRLLISLIFVVSGIGKLMDPEGIATYMASKNVPLIPFSLYTGAAVEIIGGLMLLTGFYSRMAALVLFLFLIPATLIFHNFWDVPLDQSAAQMVEFLKNVAIMGGLLYIIATGAGKASLDHFFYKDKIQ